MGAKGTTAICLYCGKIVKRGPHDRSAYVKCIPCQKAGKTKLLPMSKFMPKKMAWLRSLRHVKQRK